MVDEMNIEDVKVGMVVIVVFGGRAITVQSINREKQQVTGDSGKGYDKDIHVCWLRIAEEQEKDSG